MHCDGYNVSQERFIEVWNSSRSYEEVAAALRMPMAAVVSREADYRAEGVKMKDLLNVTELRLLVQTLNRELLGQQNT